MQPIKHLSFHRTGGRVRSLAKAPSLSDRSIPTSSVMSVKNVVSKVIFLLFEGNEE